MVAQLEYSLDGIGEAAARFWEITAPHRVFAFNGQMGAGKTSFIHALCLAKGVTDSVGSPTFSLINEYGFRGPGGPGRIYHMDLYRLRSTEEAIQTGIEDSLYSGDYCLVEWAEKAPGIFPAHTVTVEFEVTGETSRRLLIAAG